MKLRHALVAASLVYGGVVVATSPLRSAVGLVRDIRAALPGDRDSLIDDLETFLETMPDAYR